MPKEVGSVQKKILLLLAAGVSLAFAQTPGKYHKVVGQLAREWRKINERSRQRAIRRLYKSKLVAYREQGDGRIQLVLSEQGKRRTLAYKFDEMSLTIPARWDGRWRIVLFDIPERLKQARDAFRFHMKRLRFHQLQKSAFVTPYECRDELDFLIEFYDLRPFVRLLTVQHIDTDLHLKQIFNV